MRKQEKTMYQIEHEKGHHQKRIQKVFNRSIQREVGGEGSGLFSVVDF
jgi:hypothetical protein